MRDPTTVLTSKFAMQLTLCALLLWSLRGYAHHVLGRPSYNLNEDSNTPPSLQVETRIGEYFIAYMVFPAFPQPNQPGRVNFYASHLDSGAPYTGTVNFAVRDDNWFNTRREMLGVQEADDNVFRQRFEFREAGKYLITASFEAGGDPYVIDFPLRIGQAPPFGPLGVCITLLILILGGTTLLKHKRVLRAKLRAGRADTPP